MNGQLIATLSCVALASCYLGFGVFRIWKGRKSGCGGGCGCAATSQSPPKSGGNVVLIPSEQLTLRRRDAAKP